MRTSVWVSIVCPATGRVLLARRSSKVRNAGQWNLFGGGLGRGERPVKTAIRELKEEAGIAITQTDLVALGAKTLGSKRNLLFGLVFEAEFAPLLNRENDKSQWVPVTQLARLDHLHSPTRLFASVVENWAETLIEPPPLPLPAAIPVPAPSLAAGRASLWRRLVAFMTKFFSPCGKGRLSSPARGRGPG